MASPAGRLGLGPAQRVSSTASPSNENAPNSVPRVAQLSALKSALRSEPRSDATPVGRPTRGVRFAQEEALRAFGGKSLGHVLADQPVKQVPAAPAAGGVRVPTRRERAQQEAFEAFRGADLADITNEVKQKLEDASAKHLALVEKSSQEIIRRKLDLRRDNGAKASSFSGDLAELDVKPALSLVERDRREFLERQAVVEQQQPARTGAESTMMATAAAQEEEARRVREAERAARVAARLEFEQQRMRKVAEAKAERQRGRVAPFMQKTEAEAAPEEPVQQQLQAPPQEAPAVVFASAAPATHEVEEDEECATPDKALNFKTAPSSPMASPGDVPVDDSIGELLDQISMDNLSAELTPEAGGATTSGPEDVLELATSLQKRKTPIVRQPFYEPKIESGELRQALEEVAQIDCQREAAMMASTRQSLEGYTVKQLKEELKERGLKVSGLKQELIDRLMQEYERVQQRGGGDNKCTIM